jgi:hypothetical protein
MKLIRNRSVVFNESWIGPSRMDTADIHLPKESDDEEEEMLPQQEIGTPLQVPTEVPAPSSWLSVLQHLELERISKISEAPRSRCERAQVSRATSLNDEAQPAYESGLLAQTSSQGRREAPLGASDQVRVRLPRQLQDMGSGPI